MPRVFLVAGHPDTDAVRVRAAGLWLGRTGAVSGPGAAWWHRMLPAAPSVVELTVPYRIDIAFPDAMVTVEIDGWAWHMDVDRFRADRHKGNALVRGRWDPLRFTWHDLTNRPDYVVVEICAAIAAATSRS